ncbi:TPA: hypothetical protein DIS56_02665 [Candidatus Saccharibacteria bacterium]|nr:MAG: hypothetical protein A3F05_02750 [Candidatus Saccharibacteria bacterium RIFCSPHIGHO2_12_FULL_47_17]HCM52013.1 hypothetical protein [Candidatus Saccharibacteria bacterium]
MHVYSSQIRKRAIAIASIATLILLPFVGLFYFILGIGVGFSEGGTLGGYGASASSDLQPTTRGTITMILGATACLALLVLCWVHFYKRTLKKSLNK